MKPIFLKAYDKTQPKIYPLNTPILYPTITRLKVSFQFDQVSENV